MYRLISSLTCVTLGYAYPGYQTFKLLKSGQGIIQPAKFQQLLKFWTVMASFTVLEFFTDFLIFWLPFYYELKLFIILYLTLPQVQGFLTFYDRYLYPGLEKREAIIDQTSAQLIVIAKAYMDRGLDKGYSLMFDAWEMFVVKGREVMRDQRHLLIATGESISGNQPLSITATNPSENNCIPVTKTYAAGNGVKAAADSNSQGQPERRSSIDGIKEVPRKSWLKDLVPLIGLFPSSSSTTIAPVAANSSSHRSPAPPTNPSDRRRDETMPPEYDEVSLAPGAGNRTAIMNELRSSPRNNRTGIFRYTNELSPPHSSLSPSAISPPPPFEQIDNEELDHDPRVFPRLRMFSSASNVRSRAG